LPADVSVVIPTHDRVQSCEVAVRSVLAQEPPPREVLVCDNGSTDNTAERFIAWGREDARVRYLPVTPPTNGPGRPRNTGLAVAQGAWIAFLDDDDEWMPAKLARQLEAAAGGADLVATNAVRTSDGRPYLPQDVIAGRLERGRLLAANLIITSSVLVRAELIEAVGGFPEAARRQGIEDYATWLACADRGAHMLLLDEPMVRYRNVGDDRFGALGPAVQRQIAALHLRRWARRPLDRHQARWALNHVATAVRGSSGRRMG
jgi:glycosyltransferase involved in cell wall biosynthesis